MKFRYHPGNYPTPMLAYYTQPNVNVFDECVAGMKELYSSIPHYHKGDQHYWNMNAYVIVDEAQATVKSFAFLEFMYVVFLLRVINRELMIEVELDIYKQNKSDFDALSTELILIEE